MTLANNMKAVFAVKGDKRASMSINFAFFNQSEKIYKRAKNGFIRRFGLDKWKESKIDNFKEAGIMLLLNQPITDEIQWFVETVCFLVNEEHCTRKRD